MPEEKKQKEILATIVGLLIAGVGIAFTYIGLLGEWVSVIMIGLGLGIVFPNRLKDAMDALASIFPFAKSKKE